MSKPPDIKITSVPFGRQWPIPNNAVRAEPTLARADLVLDSGERLPVRETVEKLAELVAELTRKKSA
jgi:hypothetical protein